MRWRIEPIVAPAAEPVLLADAKAHLRVDGVGEDALITGHIVAARERVEAHTGRRMIDQQWRLYLDDLCGEILLPDLAPVKTIDSVTYFDATGNRITLATGVYQLVKSAPARIVLAYNQSWPSTRGDTENVQVNVTSGYGTAGTSVPKSITSAMLLIIGHLYTHRDEVIDAQAFELPQGVEALLAPYSVPRF